MKPLVATFGSLSLGFAINTAMLAIAQVNRLVIPFLTATIVMGVIALSVAYVDWRLRNNLLALVENMEERATKPTDLYSLNGLKLEIKKGMSLALAAKAITHISERIGYKGQE